ncbi:hypothetical protein [Stenotrophomonas rhizophila]
MGVAATGLGLLLAGVAAAPLTSITTEDGVTATHYVSRHQLHCGDSRFDITVEAGQAAPVTAFTVNDVALPPEQVRQINDQIGARSGFLGLRSSCTRQRQALTLQFTSPTRTYGVAVRFVDGRLASVAGAAP